MSHEHSRSRMLPLVILAAAVAAISACSGSYSSTGTTLTNADLVGSYTLVSISQGGSQPIGPPIATGTLVLADSTYAVNVTVATQPPTVISDTGIFHVNGSSWSQRSTMDPTQPQATGSVTFRKDTLVVSANSGGVVTNMVWFR